VPLRFWSCLNFHGLALASVLMACSPTTQPSHEVPEVRITGLTLTLLDPGLGTRGVRVAFEPEGDHIFTSFEIFRSTRADSLGAPIASAIPTDAPWVEVALPDTSPPYKVFFGVRAVRRIETGEQWFSEKITLDSLAIQPAVRIYRPAQGDTLIGNQVIVEVGALSDPGITLRQAWWHHENGSWVRGLDTCLPRLDCETPRFGNVSVQDTLFLNPVSNATTSGSFGPNGLVCVHGSEVFDGRSTAIRQSLACARFWRVKP
jgi:hypothetical protein